jgi:hypothetical protein
MVEFRGSARVTDEEKVGASTHPTRLRWFATWLISLSV